jgi:predicted DNA-binding protein YlxM (UPF0122 family)
MMITKAEDTRVRSFIYMDEYLLSSLSSQVFSGSTHSVVQSAREVEVDSEDQKGLLGSGRLLAHSSEREVLVEERKVLYDHAYSLLEDRLIDSGLVADINSRSDIPDADKIGLVRVSGTAVFNDIEATTELISVFNDFGESLAYVTTNKERKDVEAELEDQIDQEKDRNKKVRLRARLKELKNVVEIAKKMNLHQDKDYLDHLVKLLRMGYGSEIELGIYPQGVGDDVLFTAVLDRENLRRASESIIRKYTRRAQTEFTVFGIVTRVGSNIASNREKELPAPQEGTVRGALLKMAHALGEIENQFVEAHGYEYIVDPIAVYREL